MPFWHREAVLNTTSPRADAYVPDPAPPALAVLAWFDSASSGRPTAVAVAEGRRVELSAALESLFFDGLDGARRCVPWLVASHDRTQPMCAYAAIVSDSPAGVTPRSASPRRGRVHSGFVVNPTADDKARLDSEFRGVLATRSMSLPRAILESALRPNRAGRIDVGILRGAVHRDGSAIDISGGEFAILSTLALAGRPQTIRSLGNTLWPERDEDSAYNLVKVYFHRIRSRVGRKDVIQTAGTGFRLASDVGIDVIAAESVLRTTAGNAGLTALEQQVLEEAHAAFAGGGYRRLSRLDNYSAMERRFTVLGGELASRLCAHAWSHDDPQRALAIADAHHAAEPLDEVGMELVIRAHKALGNRDAAVRRFRCYADAIRSELDVDPPEYIAELVR
jgi:DNA-binding SARP family transcriptional activator